MGWRMDDDGWFVRELGEECSGGERVHDPRPSLSNYNQIPQILPKRWQTARQKRVKKHPVEPFTVSLYVWIDWHS